MYLEIGSLGAEFGRICSKFDCGIAHADLDVIRNKKEMFGISREKNNRFGRNLNFNFWIEYCRKMIVVNKYENNEIWTYLEGAAVLEFETREHEDLLPRLLVDVRCF